MAPSKKAEKVEEAKGMETVLLPAVIGQTAKDLETNLVPAVLPLIPAMPTDLGMLLQKRFVTPIMNPQPKLPGEREATNIQVSWIKTVNPLTQNKTFRGKRLLDGTVLAKSVLYVPGETKVGFPFIVLGGWEERLLGSWDTKKSMMDTRCQSRDGVSAAVVNAWGETECKSCQHDTRNRPKYEQDPDPKHGRCKRKMNLIGIGGDFEDFYVLQVSGKAIIDFYSKCIVKQLKEASNMGLPWYTKTFILRTVEDGTFWTWQMEDIFDTVTLPGVTGDEGSYWKDLSPSQVELVLATLSVLQKTAQKYVTERQDAARTALAKSKATGERVALPEDEDTDVPAGVTAGLA